MKNILIVCVFLANSSVQAQEIVFDTNIAVLFQNDTKLRAVSGSYENVAGEKNNNEISFSFSVKSKDSVIGVATLENNTDSSLFFFVNRSANHLFLYDLPHFLFEGPLGNIESNYSGCGTEVRLVELAPRHSCRLSSFIMASKNRVGLNVFTDRECSKKGMRTVWAEKAAE